MQHIECVYFGHAGRLFGTFHDARSEHRRDEAVLICPPLFSEYYRSHYTIRKLALELSSIGYDVLRFDYGGTGDSLGDLNAEALVGIEDDLNDALGELRSLARPTRLHGIGIRFAAALIERHKEEFSKLVYWDPVWDSATYMLELEKANASALSKHRRLDAGQADHLRATDFMGTRCGADEIAAALSRFSVGPDPRRARVILSAASQLPKQFDGIEFARCSVEPNWSEPTLETLFAHEILNSIVAEFR